MGRKKKETKAVDIVDTETTKDVVPEVEVPQEPKIGFIEANFSREDLNQLANKLNEIITRMNE